MKIQNILVQARRRRIKRRLIALINKQHRLLKQLDAPAKRQDLGAPIELVPSRHRSGEERERT